MLYKDDYDFQEFWNMNQFGPLNLLPASDFSQNHLPKAPLISLLYEKV